MQKTITKDFLTHRSTINKGEAPRYYVENHHVGIIDRSTWDKAQTMLYEKPSKVGDSVSAQMMKSGYTGWGCGKSRKRIRGGILPCDLYRWGNRVHG